MEIKIGFILYIFFTVAYCFSMIAVGVSVNNFLNNLKKQENKIKVKMKV